MRAVTNTELFKLVECGHDCRSARLSAVDVLGRYGGTTVPAGQLHPAPAAQLAAALERQYGEPGSGDLPAYVVSCDGTPVAWLTLRGQAVAPAATLTALQHRHQDKALTALARVTDHVIVGLAERRDAYEHRQVTQSPTEHGGPAWVRVAAAEDPTRTWWTCVSADYDTALGQVRGLVGSDRVRVIRSAGYGIGATVLRHPGLDVVCAIQRTADLTGAPPAVVGEWVVTVGCQDPAAIGQQFPPAYAGRFANREEFAVHLCAVRGWTKAMTEVGMGSEYLDQSRLTYDLFRQEFLAITIPGGGGIAVIAR
ncbi:hypothetical protein GCM10010123_01970 [Pilimelia anulata]|uniref:Uncharacterized protein n=1 Tax=Pilimelia anulata TaxID=53371 RepID=A0A8J3F7D6_9ACTN|nr:hypothetical protein [Pilimelia anulata]GGJ75577.1 hypothetical protein GCM10010123_01970 [Pilimelia anulata]